MQEKCKTILIEKFPDANIRTKENQLLFNRADINAEDLDKLSYIQGMYKELRIKRSGTGIVIIITF